MAGRGSEGAGPGLGVSEVLVSVEAPEVRVAELRSGRLWGLDVERGGRLLGDIFKGRVANVVPGMDAAFVDIGLEHNALLYEGDIVHSPGGRGGPGRGAEVPRGGVGLRSGQEVVVQVARPPVGRKGARVTMKLSLPGRYVVLSEHSDSVGVSRRLDDEGERSRLRRLAERLRPLDHGLVVRTEASGATEGQLSEDVAALGALLDAVRASARSASAPSRLHRGMGLLGRLVRDRLGEGVERVLVDDPETLEALRESARRTAPHLESRIELYSGAVPLFRARGVEKDIERASSRSVPLPSGGTLVIDEAEALTAIDVNTGRFTGAGRGRGSLAETVLATNLEAVDEAARQMRLREVAGIVAIDFIDMERTRDRVRVMDALEAALAQDRAKTRIVALSPSGLVEITRQREGPSLRAALHRPCPYCSGRGVVKTPQTVAIEARRRLREASRRERPGAAPGSPPPQAPRRVRVSMHPESACALLEGEGASVEALERECGLLLHVAVDFSLHLEAAHIAEVPAGASPLEGVASGLVEGERVSLPASTPLYPADDPCFAVLHGVLVRLEGSSVPIDASRSATSASALVEVTSVGRWFATARPISK